MHLISRIIAVKTVFFVYIIAYSICSFITPETSAMRYITAVTHSNTLSYVLLGISFIFACLGVFRSALPIPMWFFLIPFVAYSFMTIYAIGVSPEVSYTGVTNFVFMIVLSVSLTWEKLDG